MSDAAATTADPLALSAEAQELLYRGARTANTFTDEPVTEAQVRAIYELYKWAPSSFNSQPMRILLVRSPEARARLVPCMSSGNQAKTGTAPLVAVLAADTDFHEHMPVVQPHKPDAAERFQDADRRERAARFNAALQSGYFILAVRAAGLAAGPMLGFDPAAVDAEFFPDGRFRSILVVNIGMPGADAFRPRLPRLAFDDVVREV